MAGFKNLPKMKFSKLDGYLVYPPLGWPYCAYCKKSHAQISLGPSENKIYYHESCLIRQTCGDDKEWAEQVLDKQDPVL